MRNASLQNRRSSGPSQAVSHATSPLVAQSGRIEVIARMSASLIGHSGSSAFRLIHHYSVDVAHGLVLLFGIGTKALPSWGSRRGGTIFGSALPLDER